MKNESQEVREIRQLLSRLPDAPVSSNFTARVMQAVELEETAASAAGGISPPGTGIRCCRGPRWPPWRLWLAGFAFHQHEISSQRAAIAGSVALVASAAAAQRGGAENFDAIQRMSQPAHADEELLALASDLK